MSDLTPDDKAALAALLRDAITTRRFPLSPSSAAGARSSNLIGGLKPEPFPPLMPPAQQSMLLPKKHGAENDLPRGQAH
jgi:hypothetical protein